MSVAKIADRIKKAQTNDERGFRSSGYATDYIYQKKCYSTTQRITVEPEGTQPMYVLFNMVPSAAGGKIVSVYTPVLSATTGPIDINYYVGSDYTGGTSFRINNRFSGGPSNLCTLTYGATDGGGGKGTQFTEGMVLSGHKSAGTTQEGLEFVPVQNTNILVELLNKNGSDATVLVNFVWFEV